jgi:Mce-associated membrane protein
MRVRPAETESLGDSQPRRVAAGRHRLPRGLSPPQVFDDELGLASGEAAVDVEGVGGDSTAGTSSPAAGGVWQRVIAYRLLPALLVILGAGAGYLTWIVVSAHFMQSARIDAVHAAQEGTVAMLTYGPGTADRDLGAARERLTGKFKDSYTLFTHQEVIPGARQKHITSVVNVLDTALVRVTTDHAVVMVFVNQTFISDSDPPTSTASSVRVTLDKVGRRWLISEFTPV